MAMETGCCATADIVACSLSGHIGEPYQVAFGRFPLDSTTSCWSRLPSRCRGNFSQRARRHCSHFESAVSRLTNSCSLGDTRCPVLEASVSSRAPVVEEVKHEPHCASFLTEVTTPCAVQSTEEPKGAPSYSCISQWGKPLTKFDGTSPMGCGKLSLRKISELVHTVCTSNSEH